MYPLGGDFVKNGAGGLAAVVTLGPPVLRQRRFQKSTQVSIAHRTVGGYGVFSPFWGAES
jgi:hypothetical protein